MYPHYFTNVNLSKCIYFPRIIHCYKMSRLDESIHYHLNDVLPMLSEALLQNPSKWSPISTWEFLVVLIDHRLLMFSFDSLISKTFVYIPRCVFYFSTRRFVSNLYTFLFLLVGWNTLYYGLQTLSFFSTPSFMARIIDLGIS